jgi:hypothetical protein
MKRLLIAALIVLLGNYIQSIKMKKYCNCAGAKAMTGNNKPFYFSGEIKERNLNKNKANSFLETNRVLIVEPPQKEARVQINLNEQFRRNQETYRGDRVHFVQVKQQHTNGSVLPQNQRFLENGDVNNGNGNGMIQRQINAEERAVIEHDNVNLLD